MKEMVLVAIAAVLAHLIVWCRDPMAGWRQRIEDECAANVAEFHRLYGVEVTGKEAVLYPGWMAAKE